ncbi:LPS export ABC transporter periplasmic protein LptC [bacterium]|nr:LPS export ABC transporter periplasmic protein LptC [bacterium]
MEKSRKRKKRYAYAAVVVSVLGVFAFAFFRPDLNLNPAPEVERADFMFTNVKMIQFNDGKIEMKVEAEKAEIDRGQQEVRLKNMSGTFITPSQLPLELQSPSASVIVDRGLFRLEAAQIRFHLGEKQLDLTSRVLDWDSRRGILRAVGEVAIVSDRYKMKGAECLADLNNRKIRLKGPARGEFVP